MDMVTWESFLPRTAAGTDGSKPDTVLDYGYTPIPTESKDFEDYIKLKDLHFEGVELSCCKYSL